MTTATAVSTSTAFTGITWKALTGNSVDNARIKISYAGGSREINVGAGHNLDPLTDAIAIAIKKELATNMSTNQWREGTISITAASTLTRTTADTDLVPF
jgi:hypothetical protein